MFQTRINKIPLSESQFFRCRDTFIKTALILVTSILIFWGVVYQLELLPRIVLYNTGQSKLLTMILGGIFSIPALIYLYRKADTFAGQGKIELIHSFFWLFFFYFATFFAASRVIDGY